MNWNALLVGSAVVLAAGAQPESREGVAFFEKHIRPVLVQHCYRCHSAKAKRLRGDLRLDTREGLRKGGETGPAIVPGQPEKSLLIRALRYQELEMPPKGKLPEAVIRHFEQWIAMGAPDPRTGKEVAADKPSKIDFAKARRHWSIRPVRKPPLPRVKDESWPTSPIDRFVLARLEAHGLRPSPPADRRTLIRRVYFDLIGLPPTYEEVQAFVKDTRPDAYARLVDRLLQSPHYGERWARHWLDVARYADTKDLVLVFGRDRIRPYAYTYRDYVIRAFNEDLPYDQFIKDQLAADMIRPKVEPWRLAAMGFLTLGRLYCNSLPDIYDDQIDTTSRAFLGLTVSCARCHDHKYDAITQADYYALYGVFASSERPLDRPLIAQPPDTPEYRAFAKRMKQKRDELQRHIDNQYREITELVRSQTIKYLAHVTIEEPDPLETAVFFLSLSPNDLRPQIVVQWRKYLKEHSRPDDPVFGLFHALMEVPEGELAARVKSILSKYRNRPKGTEVGQVNPLVFDAVAKAAPTTRKRVVETYGKLLVAVYNDWKAAGRKTPRDPARKQLLEVLVGPTSPTYFLKRNTWMYMSRVPRGHYGNLLKQIDRLAVDSPHAPPRAMSLVDASELYEPRIFIRGNPRRPGPRVPRRFLQLLAGDTPKPFIHGSGRLELAEAIAAPDNPLTPRVMVNRVWLHHFGIPIVATPDDFGVQGDPPSHPELLDWLAATFVEDGWSLKKLHRRIVLSSTYRQASADRPECRKVDPENRLLWRYPRRMIDFEAMRDSLLALSGRLDRTIGGRPVDIARDANNRRRSIYGLVDRQELPNIFRVFNFASPDQTTGMRPQTLVPQQALFALNSPFVLNQARGLLQRPELRRAATADEKIRALYHVIYQRDPSSEEQRLARAFVTQAGGDRGSRVGVWEQLAQVLLVANEAFFID